MPISAPVPTADIGCALVKTSASGPIPTSRYCDHMPRSISMSLSRTASGEPGTTAPRSTPIACRRSERIPSAADGSPLARSSITRSSMLSAKVTPQAFTACRSTGASRDGTVPPAAGRTDAARMSARLPMSRPSALLTPAQAEGRFSSSEQVGARPVMSTTRSPRTVTTAGPPGTPGSHARPTRTARSRSPGRVSATVSSSGIAGQSATHFWRCSPSPSMARCISSPAFRNTGSGLTPSPTPGGVPVEITSPGCRVKKCER